MTHLQRLKLKQSATHIAFHGNEHYIILGLLTVLDLID